MTGPGVGDRPAPDDRLRPLAAPVGGVVLWELTLRPRPGDAGAALLDDADRLRLAGLAPAPARALVTRRALVAAAVAGRAGVPVTALRWAPEGGRPAVALPAGAPLAVSLSTSGARALLAVAAAPVGVDLEVAAVLPDAADVAALLAPAERAWVLAAPGPSERSARLLRVWVRKEAVVKCTGEGLGGTDLRSFVVDAAAAGTAEVRDAAGAPTGLATVDLPLPGAHAALALRPEAVRAPAAA